MGPCSCAKWRWGSHINTMNPLLQGRGGGQCLSIGPGNITLCFLSVKRELFILLGPSWHICEPGIRISPFPGCGDRVSYRLPRHPLDQGGS